MVDDGKSPSRKTYTARTQRSAHGNKNKKSTKRSKQEAGFLGFNPETQHTTATEIIRTANESDISFIEENMYLEDEDLEHSYDIQDIQEEDLEYIENLSHEKIPHEEPILRKVTELDLEEIFGNSPGLSSCKSRNSTPAKKTIRQAISYPIDYYIQNGTFTE